MSSYKALLRKVFNRHHRHPDQDNQVAGLHLLYQYPAEGQCPVAGRYLAEGLHQSEVGRGLLLGHYLNLGQCQEVNPVAARPGCHRRGVFGSYTYPLSSTVMIPGGRGLT